MNSPLKIEESIKKINKLAIHQKVKLTYEIEHNFKEIINKVNEINRESRKVMAENKKLKFKLDQFERETSGIELMSIVDDDIELNTLEYLS